MQHITMDTPSLWPLAKRNQLLSSMCWYCTLQSDFHQHLWALPDTHYWLFPRCQNSHSDSKTSLCTAHPRSHWTHARILLLHQARTSRSCNILLESHSDIIARLLSRRNHKHRCWYNQTSHSWRQQSPLLCCFLPTLWCRHPSSRITRQRTTNFCGTWEPLIEYWWFLWTYSPFPKPTQLQPTCKFCTPTFIKSAFSTSRHNLWWFSTTPTASLHQFFNDATKCSQKQ